VVYDGVPLDDVEIALAHFTDEGEDGDRDGVGDGDGEILLRAPMLMRCYRDGADGRVTGPDGRRDWFATGDAGYVHEDGTLGVRGRVREVIVTGGEKVWPDAVERVLAAHPGVIEVAVWKRADPEWGERVVAWIVPADPAPSAAELTELVKASLAPWAAPKEIIFSTTLPRLASGKVRRSDLR
jgi:O-succinylbenzoic acid--CoA ligase